MRGFVASLPYRALVLAIVLTFACTAPPGPAPDPAAPDAHAQLDGRLGEVMRELSTLADDRLPKAMDLEVAEAERRREVRLLALALAQAADAIPAPSANTPLEPKERAEFARLAQQLGAEARALANAPQDSRDDLAARAESIRAVCNACHLRFRIPGAPDEP